MASLTITVEGMMDGKQEIITKTVTIPDETFPDYLESCAQQYNQYHVISKMRAKEVDIVTAHIDEMIKETDRVLNGYLHRKTVNAALANHKPVNLKG